MNSKYSNEDKENPYYNFIVFKNMNSSIQQPRRKEKLKNFEILCKKVDEVKICKNCRKRLTSNHHNPNNNNNIPNYGVKKMSRSSLKDAIISNNNDEHYINISGSIPFRPTNIKIKDPIYENIEVYNQVRLNAINNAKAKSKNLLKKVSLVTFNGVSNQYLRSYNPYMPMCTPIIIPSSKMKANEIAKKSKQCKRAEIIKKHSM